MKFPTIDIYSQKNLYQIFIGINLALIGIASVFYTYNIVESLDAREQRQLTVYAQLIEYQANHPDLNEDYTALFQIWICQLHYQKKKGKNCCRKHLKT